MAWREEEYRLNQAWPNGGSQHINQLSKRRQQKRGEKKTGRRNHQSERRKWRRRRIGVGEMWRRRSISAAGQRNISKRISGGVKISENRRRGVAWRKRREIGYRRLKTGVKAENKWPAGESEAQQAENRINGVKISA